MVVYLKLQYMKNKFLFPQTFSVLSRIHDCFSTRLTLPQQNLELDQLEIFCRRRNKCIQKNEISFRKGGKHCEKRRKCRLSAFSPFPTMFSKASFFSGP